MGRSDLSDPMFAMTVDQLLIEMQEQLFIAKKARGAVRKAAIVRIDSLARCAIGYVVMGFPEPASQVLR